MSDENGAGGAVVLLVGVVEGPVGAVHVSFARLDAAVLARVAPALVICALVAADCDAVMVAERLTASRWSGRLRVIADGLPDRRMVQRELQALAPHLVIEVVAR